VELIPTQEEIIALLRQTGALRDEFTHYKNGLCSDYFLKVPIALRFYQSAKLLNVALSRMVRSHPELRAITPELSIVAPAPNGLPVAYGVCEALRAKQVYWAERDNENEPQKFLLHMETAPGERVLLVDDVLQTGAKVKELKGMVEGRGGIVVGVAVIVVQPSPILPDFGSMPIFRLATMPPLRYETQNAGAGVLIP
jgi:orotate phosphoribosyltransferase